MTAWELEVESAMKLGRIFLVGGVRMAGPTGSGSKKAALFLMERLLLIASLACRLSGEERGQEREKEKERSGEAQ